MRFLGFGSLLLGVSAIVSACDRKPTPQEAELLLAKAYKHASVSFNCQEGERDWLYICYVTQHPTSSGMKTPPVRRAGVKSMGTYHGDPILAYKVLPDQGPVPSQDEQEAWEKADLSRRQAEHDARNSK
jgi:hypothetical protein